MKVAIIGGSIAGCTAAFVLRRAGIEVQVFERSSKPLVGRGASLVLAWPLLQTCRQAGLLGDDLPLTEVTSLDYFCRDSALDERWLGAASLRAAAMHWSDLYTALRAHVPNDRFHLGAAVDRQASVGDQVEVGFEDGSTAVFDAVVYADGYRSFGRSLVDPNVHPASSDVVLVRGVTAEEPADRRLDGKGARFLYPDGHGVCYIIPGEDGATDVGRRRVSCSFYLPARDEYGLAQAIDTLREDASLTTLDALFLGASTRLDEFLDRYLPNYFAELLRRTSNFYVQPIFSIRVQRHFLGRACPIGDAAGVFPPYTNSGVLKAVSNAFSLAEMLGKGRSVVNALSGWDEKQREMDERIAVDSQRAGKMLIYEVPNVATFGGQQMQNYLKALHPGFDIRTEG